MSSDVFLSLYLTDHSVTPGNCGRNTVTELGIGSVVVTSNGAGSRQEMLYRISV